VNIKAQGLLNATKWIEEQYGQAALRDILRACSPAVRERYISAIAINWHPVEEFVEFLEIADRQVGRGDGRIAEEVGAAGARSNMRGAVLRMVFFLSRPEFLMRRITQLWSQFNDEGSMELIAFADYSSAIEVKGITHPYWYFCCTLSGWARELARGAGGGNPVAHHVECRARGAQRCIWHVKWTGQSKSEIIASKKGPALFPPDPKQDETPPPSRSSSRHAAVVVPPSERVPHSEKKKP
jgi:hypothetical protein